MKDRLTSIKAFYVMSFLRSIIFSLHMVAASFIADNAYTFKKYALCLVQVRAFILLGNTAGFNYIFYKVGDE